MEIGRQNGIRKLKLPINQGSAPLFKDHKMPEIVFNLVREGGGPD